MSLGVEVNFTALPPARTAPAPTGRWVVAGTTGSGPLMTPTVLRSVAELVAAFGARDSANRIVYDAAELFFRSGGAELVLVRVGASTVVKDLALWTAALDAVDASFGPGQVSIPGEIGAAHTAVLAHAAATGRVALLDEEVDTDQTERLALLTTLEPLTGAKRGILLGPWVVTPGPTAGTTVTVPASAQVAARLNALETVDGHAGRAPIAEQGMFPPAGASTFAAGLAQTLTRAQQQEAFDAGFGLLTVPVATGLPTLQSFRSLSDADPAFAQLTVARMAQDLDFRFDAVGAAFRGQSLTRDLLSEIGGALEAECLPLVSSAGPLFDTGDRLRPPYTVDVGPLVNTDPSIASGVGRAAVGVRLAPYLDLVTIDVVARIAGS